MSYTPILNNWKNRENNKKWKYDEYSIQLERNSFSSILSEWIKRNNYLVIEETSEAIVLARPYFGRFNIPITACLIIFYSNPIIMHCFLLSQFDKFENFKNGLFKEPMKLSQAVGTPPKEVQALLLACK